MQQDMLVYTWLGPAPLLVIVASANTKRENEPDSQSSREAQ